jgi:Flp pilus assembly protein TadG
VPDDDDHGEQLMKRLLNRSDRSKGQALVEFALVFPILILLIFGLLDFGRVLYTQNALSQSAREGARWGSVQARSSTDIDGIEDFTLGRLSGVDTDAVSVTATCIRPGDIVLPCQAEDTLEVHVETSLEMVTPVIAQLMQAVGANPITLTATSQVVVNN